ncbi:hypothetical protein [Chloroflexus sp.]|uniref:hypothetical protein n=1 Tax=Chloroflexus sp. TaxID=1904827 RepID=UPI00298ED6E7|nr:hypothetical protein [Chloroflexus sp.]MDW8404840.1 hypothetical protein [Chloroflexus sp.]
MPTHDTCPRCGRTLTTEGAYLRCATHGLFFRYGPRRLVAAPTAEEHDYLMPWQTLAEETPAVLELPTAAATATTK